jgi:hypothetical protein
MPFRARHLVRSTSLAALRAASCVAVLTLAFAPRLGAQAAVAPQGPAGWTWSLDHPARFQGGGKAIGTDSLFEFTQMAPGWHLTMGPGGVLYDPRENADHRYVLSAELILFPDASLQGEYGVFVGGKGLEGQSAQWVAFVVRGDGASAVLQRTGSETREVLPWATRPGVKARPAGTGVTNVVQVQAEADSVRFVVNGERVATFGRGEMDLNGIFGFRIGNGVNLHATNLDLTRRLAPARRR